MKYLLARIESYPRYQGENSSSPAVMGYAQDGNIPHEIYNFFEAADSKIYGYLPKEGGRDLERLGAVPGAKHVAGITVIFISDGKVCGYYLNATIFAERQIHPDNLKAGASDIYVVAQVAPKNAVLVPLDSRTSAMKPRPKGTFPVLYGNDESDWAIWFEQWRKEQEVTKALISEKKRKKSSERVERSSNARNVALNKFGYLCEACGITSNNEIGRSIFEVHHKTPYSTDFEKRDISVDDLAVLCANCHRRIHKLPDISDISILKTFMDAS